MQCHWGALLLSALTLSSCKKDLEINPKGYPQFPEPVYQYEGGAPNEKIAALGAKLFFDPILSLDSSVSCVSCHAPEHAFAIHNEALSQGVNGAVGIRNSPSIANMIYYPYFGWDGGILNLEIQPVTPITDTLEMHSSFPLVRGRLSQHSMYKDEFAAAFNADSITDKQILVALTQYVAKIISNRSKYDLYIQGSIDLNEEEQRGKVLFEENCSSCHGGILFSNFGFYKNGLSGLTQKDYGRYRITLDPSDKGRFRVPSLRNVALTYPYLHDGSVKSLDSVLQQYTNPPFANDLPGGAIPLSPKQQKEIIAFLKTLSDFELVNDRELLPDN